MFRGNFNISLFRKQIASESMLIFFFKMYLFDSDNRDRVSPRFLCRPRAFFFARTVGRHLDFCKHHLETQHLFWYETGNLSEGRSPKISIIRWSVHVSLTGSNYEQFRWYWHLIINLTKLMKLIACSYFRLNTNIPFES